MCGAPAMTLPFHPALEAAQSWGLWYGLGCRTEDRLPPREKVRGVWPVWAKRPWVLCSVRFFWSSLPWGGQRSSPLQVWLHGDVYLPVSSQDRFLERVFVSFSPLAKALGALSPNLSGQHPPVPPGSGSWVLPSLRNEQDILIWPLWPKRLRSQCSAPGRPKTWTFLHACPPGSSHA